RRALLRPGPDLDAAHREAPRRREPPLRQHDARRLPRRPVDDAARELGGALAPRSRRHGRAPRAAREPRPGRARVSRTGRGGGVTGWVADLGDLAHRFVADLGRWARFTAGVARAVLTPPVRLRAFVDELYKLGVLSIVIIVVCGLAVGMVLGLQGYNTLARF